MPDSQERNSCAAASHDPCVELQDICEAILHGGKITFRTEVELHAIIHSRIGTEFEHEYRQSNENRFDFFCKKTGLVVEIKVRRNAEKELFYQVERYTRCPEVKGCLVIAPFFRGIIPSIINDKPVFQLALWKLRL